MKIIGQSNTYEYIVKLSKNELEEMAGKGLHIDELRTNCEVNISRSYYKLKNLDKYRLQLDDVITKLRAAAEYIEPLKNVIDLIEEEEE
jgi:hypothetical protein